MFVNSPCIAILTQTSVMNEDFKSITIQFRLKVSAVYKFITELLVISWNS